MSETANTDKPESFFQEKAEQGISTPQQDEQPKADIEQPTGSEGAQPDSRIEAVETEVPTGEQTESGVSKPENSDKEIPDKDNPDSYKYFQSQVDKYQAKLGAKPDEISDAQAELFKVLTKGSPELLGDVVNYLKTGGQQEAKPGGNSTKESPKAERPVKPEKPTDYNPYELNDPQSSAFQYQQQYQQYLEDTIEYERNQREKLQSNLMQTEEQRKVQDQREQFQNTVKQEAMTKRGYSEEQANQFADFVDKAVYGKFEENEVYTMFEGFSGVSADKQRKEIQSREQELQRQKDLREKHGIPSPAVSGAGSTPKQQEEDGFFQVVDG